MNFKQIYQPYNEEVMERYPLVIERILQIQKEETTKEPFQSYFIALANFIIEVHNTREELNKGQFFNKSYEELKLYNQKLYEDILPKNYGKSYANPAYAVKELGDTFGNLLSFLYSELRAMIAYAFEDKKYHITILCELFVEIYNGFESDITAEEVKEIIYWFYLDYCEVFMDFAIMEQVNPEMDFFTKIIMESDLSNPMYLYKYGSFISENEIGVHNFMKEMSEEEVQSMADTYTEGYRIGFVNTGKDLSKKKTVEIHYPIGFERMIRLAIQNFEKMGLKPVMIRNPITSFFNKGNNNHNVVSTSPNRQYDYDHKSDRALYLDKKFIERRLECMKNSFEKQKELAGFYAGPAVVEVFGEKTFEPENKKESYQYSEEQQKLNVYFANMAGKITNEYIKGEERSFTIIAYPVPEIGSNFKEIFAETVKINTLDYMSYQKMQQNIIDILDQGEFVHITGKGKNKTDLTVALYPINNSLKETKFENCVADVNIPVGEVFTTPVLKGTNGILHVTQVYLRNLKYIDLELVFTDGMITSYHCKNFSTEEENLKFIKEELLHHHDTLPMGEFAIGTNTTAYKMGKDYNIADKLPILIAEKTGPHFAVGDTCYNREEDNITCNPNGKQIVARDNEISIQRKVDEEKAYFNCHTDITIPYDELDCITVVLKDKTTIDVIRDGKFVVEGTEDLNLPLE